MGQPSPQKQARSLRMDCPAQAVLLPKMATPDQIIRKQITARLVVDHHLVVVVDASRFQRVVDRLLEGPIFRVSIVEFRSPLACPLQQQALTPVKRPPHMLCIARQIQRVGVGLEDQKLVRRDTQLRCQFTYRKCAAAPRRNISPLRLQQDPHRSKARGRRDPLHDRGRPVSRTVVDQEQEDVVGRRNLGLTKAQGRHGLFKKGLFIKAGDDESDWHRSEPSGDACSPSATALRARLITPAPALLANQSNRHAQRCPAPRRAGYMAEAGPAGEIAARINQPKQTGKPALRDHLCPGVQPLFATAPRGETAAVRITERPTQEPSDAAPAGHRCAASGGRNWRCAKSRKSRPGQRPRKILTDEPSGGPRPGPTDQRPGFA